MIVYLASPNTQQQAEHVADMPVLLSYRSYGSWMDGYHPSFSRILIDSGAFNALTSGKPVDIKAYADWAERWRGHVDAIAGVDDIAGDWRLSLKNYEEAPIGFPTIHDTDPRELLPELIALAQTRKQWLGIGLKPPREGKEEFIRWVCDNVPETLHLHGWALRRYTHVRRLNSVDSTNWWRDALILRNKMPWLTYGETLEIIVKRYQRWTRIIKDEDTDSLFSEPVDTVEPDG